MPKRSDAHRAADARYNAKRERPVRVELVLTDSQAALLDTYRRQGEARATVIKRILGLGLAEEYYKQKKLNDANI
jgi:hypothetical protein